MNAAELDTRGFDAFIQGLTEISGKPREEVLGQQAGHVLSICITRSPGPKSGNYKDAQFKAALRVMKPSRYVDEKGTLVPPNNRVGRPERPFLQTLTGTRGGRLGHQWYVGTNRAGARVFIPQERIESGNWAKGKRVRALQTSIAGGLEPKAQAAAKAVGALKKSWVQIAQRVNAPLKTAVPVYVRKSSTPFDDGARSRFVQQGATSFVELVNTNGALIRRYNGAAILQGAIQQRLRAFQHDIKHDVFADITYRAARYPGIFVAE